MKKHILFLFAILLLCQGLSATPLPNPEPEFSIIDAINKVGAYLFNSIIYVVVSVVEFVSNGLVYVVVGITKVVISTITVTNAVLANSFTAINSASTNAVNAINHLVNEFNNAVSDDLTIDPPGVVFGSSLIASSGENVQAISCGVQYLASVFTSMRGVSCEFGSSGPREYPVAPALLPLQPNTTTLPVAVAISIQATYALQIIQRLNSDISMAVQKYEDIRNATGISCPQNCTLSRNLTNAYSYISTVLNAQVNNQLKNRLVTVFNASAIIQVNDAIIRTRQFLDCVRANAECTSAQIRAYNNKPFAPLIASLANNSTNATQYSSSVRRIMNLTSDYSQLYIRNVFASLNSSRNRAFSEIEASRQSLILQVNLTLAALNGRAFLVWDPILMPKVTAFRTKLATIEPSMQSLFANMTAQRNATAFVIQAAVNSTYQNASLDVSAKISNLTNYILSNASSTSNCQNFVEQIQGLQAVFSVEAGKCIVLAYQSAQSSLDNQTGTTKEISDLFNNITGNADKCFRDNTNWPLTWVPYLTTAATRQTIATCLDTVIQQTDAFIANANVLVRYANNDVPTSAEASIATANECISMQTSQVLVGVNVIETGFEECKAANAA
ncbi:unnamed protein product [Diamesa hyperborea]